MQEAPVECSHDPCNCSVIGPVEGGEVYCSDFCRGAEQGLESESCGCGHPQCDTAWSVFAESRTTWRLGTARRSAILAPLLLPAASLSPSMAPLGGQSFLGITSCV